MTQMLADYETKSVQISIRVISFLFAVGVTV